MSRFTKRTWSEQTGENDNGLRIMNNKQNSESDSRESSSSRKKSKPNSDKSSKIPRKPVELETDTTILQRRQKQIDYGKNTVGYHNYMQQVPLDQRTKEHPKTPEKYTKYSRRSWDTLIKMWRKKLHEYDTESKDVDGDNSIVDDDDNDIVHVDIVDDDIDDGLSYHSGECSSPIHTSEIE